MAVCVVYNVVVDATEAVKQDDAGSFALAVVVSVAYVGAYVVPILGVSVCALVVFSVMVVSSVVVVLSVAVVVVPSVTVVVVPSVFVVVVTVVGVVVTVVGVVVTVVSVVVTVVGVVVSVVAVVEVDDVVIVWTSVEKNRVMTIADITVASNKRRSVSKINTNEQISEHQWLK